MQHKILVILGPTATGKSDLAVKIAKQIESEKLDGFLGAEIISADSRQVYRGLDIGTGKITASEMQNVPHHLLDVAEPNERFTVSKWQQMAKECVQDIQSRNKLPIICGGTGYYISALIDNVSLPEVPTNTEEQARLEMKNTEELFAELQSLDRRRAEMMKANGEWQNKRRVARAIIVARALGAVPPLPDGAKPRGPTSMCHFLIGMSIPDDELKKRIRLRLHRRIETGMIEEAQNLHELGLSYERMDELGLEYRYLAKYLQNELTMDQFTETLATKIWQYARRQKTWFKRDKRIVWVAPTDYDSISNLVKSFLAEK